MQSATVNQTYAAQGNTDDSKLSDMLETRSVWEWVDWATRPIALPIPSTSTQKYPVNQDNANKNLPILVVWLFSSSAGCLYFRPATRLLAALSALPQTKIVVASCYSGHYLFWYFGRKNHLHSTDEIYNETNKHWSWVGTSSPNKWPKILA